ncbi:17960_t:CDS:2, partial [Entrophospora sp. SA101]
RNNNNNIIDNKLIRNQRTGTIQRNGDHQLSVADIIDYNLDVVRKVNQLDIITLVKQTSFIIV